MSELLPITLFSIIMAVISHRFSVYDRTAQCYRRKDAFIYLVMAVCMIIFVGLRTSYNDTSAYTHAYEQIDSGANPFTEAGNLFAIGNNPGFRFLNVVLAKLGFSTQSYLMFYAGVTVGIYLWFIRKYTTNIAFSIFLFVTMGCYTFTLAAIKQCVAVALALVGVDFAIRKKYIPFIVLVIIASLFHPYSLMFLIVPFMMYKPWSGRGYFFLLLFLAIGVFLQQLLGTLLDITTMLGEEYDVASFTGEGINVFRLAVCSMPLILSYAGRKIVTAEGTTADYLIINLSILNAEIMFVGLFGTANYFGRLANYFLIFQTISIPWLMRIFTKKSAELVTGIAIAGYLLYFVYANMINQSFDTYFDSISFIQYIASLR